MNLAFGTYQTQPALQCHSVIIFFIVSMVKYFKKYQYSVLLGIDIVRHSLRMPCMTIAHNAGAVSYTHLDVYKRQVLAWQFII